MQVVRGAPPPVMADDRRRQRSGWPSGSGCGYSGHRRRLGQWRGQPDRRRWQHRRQQVGAATAVL